MKQCTAVVERKFQSTFFLQRRILLLFQPFFFYMYLNKFAYIYQCSFHQRKMYEKLSLFFILNVPKTWSRSEKSNLWVIKRIPLCITRSMYHFSSRHVMLVSDFLYYTANILTAQSSVFYCVTVYTVLTCTALVTFNYYTKCCAVVYTLKIYTPEIITQWPFVFLAIFLHHADCSM